MNYSSRIILSSLLIELTLTFSAVASPHYQVTEIQPLSGHKASSIEAINNLGEAVGVSSPTNDLDIYEAKPFILTGGGQYVLPGLPDGYVSAGRINNKSIISGSFYNNRGLQSIYWMKTKGPATIPGQLDYDQYYVNSLTDGGIISGFATFYNSNDKGFTYNIATGRVVLNDSYVYGPMNNKGTLLRQISNYSNDRIELVSNTSIRELILPSGLAGPNLLDFKMSATSDTVATYLTDNDDSDGCVGCGSSCVTWSAPTYAPRVINPPDFRGRDYCNMSAPNINNAAIVSHQVYIGEDNYSDPVFYLYSQSQFYKLAESAPELSHYNNLYFTQINDRGQIVGRGLKDGYYRGLILTPIN